jgi:hypothetical protein
VKVLWRCRAACHTELTCMAWVTVTPTRIDGIPSSSGPSLTLPALRSWEVTHPGPMSVDASNLRTTGCLVLTAVWYSFGVIMASRAGSPAGLHADIVNRAKGSPNRAALATLAGRVGTRDYRAGVWVAVVPISLGATTPP